MEITFLGAAHEVTGSCTYIEVGKYKGLVDYGMQQGIDLYKNEDLPVAASDLDFVLLTHAHIDHSGLLPLLAKDGFCGKVYTSEATANLLYIMLNDSAHIQMSNAEYESRKSLRNGGCQVEPLYDVDDVSTLMKCVRPCPYNDMIVINECLTVRFTDVGHLLGSSAIELFLSEGKETRTICFSGDIGNTNQPILTDPNSVEFCDYLVIESTYGDRYHNKVDTDYVSELAALIQSTLDRGGNLIIPSFAVGRTQEMLYFIREIKEKNLVKNHDGFPVYIDSPLAVEATTVFLQCDTTYLDDEFRALLDNGINPLIFDGLRLVQTTEESKAINEDKTPKIIISASGMCEAGRIRHHLKHNLWRKESLILFVGYQAAGSLGRLLVDGIKKVKLFGDDIAVEAEIKVLPGVSGHADKEGLLNWINKIPEKPKKVFVNHGDPESADSFTNCLVQEYGFDAYAPYSGTKFNLVTGDFTFIAKGIPVDKYKEKALKAKTNSAIYKNLIEAVEKLSVAAKASSELANKILVSATDDIYRIIKKLK